MKYIICTQQQFDELNAAAVLAWNQKFPHGTCESYATPKIHPIDGRIAFPCDETLGIDYSSAQELDPTWELPSDPVEREKIIKANTYDALLSAGYDTGLGFKLSVTEESARKMNGYEAHLKRKADAGMINDSTPIPLVAQDESLHQVTYAVFKAMLIPFGDACVQAEFMKP